MFKPRPCGCKGIRTCLVCEAEFGVMKPEEDSPSTAVFEYCYLCNKAWEGEDVVGVHPNHPGTPYDFPGVLVIPDFISADEEKELVEGCDSMPWDLSQSGRRKQNFGPKTNFKKKKINGSSFEGFPAFSRFAQEKMGRLAQFENFLTIEQCAIEYRTETGASIEPHIDDCWVWGERVVSISLLSHSVLTMTKFRGPPEKYNLAYFFGDKVGGGNCEEAAEYPTVRIPMPRLSLLLLFGPARYEWEHAILRKDITDRRICMAYREFTPEYLEGGRNFQEAGQEIIARAEKFWST